MVYLLALGEGIAAWYLRFFCKLFGYHLTTFVAYPIIIVVLVEFFVANWALGHNR